MRRPVSKLAGSLSARTIAIRPLPRFPDLTKRLCRGQRAHRRLSQAIPRRRDFSGESESAGRVPPGIAAARTRGLRENVPAAVGAGADLELFRPAEPDARSAQVSR